VQVALTAALGFALALRWGRVASGAAYTAMALTFSSTIIVVKLLSDRGRSTTCTGGCAVDTDQCRTLDRHRER
jgi:Kef-type K+ transport system membrane component KefB